MEIYSSPNQQRQTQVDRPVFASRPRLVLGAVVWVILTCLFCALGWFMREKTGGMILMGILAAFGLWMIYKCLAGLTRPGTPILIFTQAGLKLENGSLLPWDVIRECTYKIGSYGPIPTSRIIEIKTTLPKKPVVLIGATTLQLGADEFLALWDAYRA